MRLEEERLEEAWQGGDSLGFWGFVGFVFFGGVLGLGLFVGFRGLGLEVLHFGFRVFGFKVWGSGV